MEKDQPTPQARPAAEPANEAGSPEPRRNTLKKYLTKRNMKIAGVVLGVIAIGVLLRMFVFKPAPKQMYQAAVVVRSQTNKQSKAEDLRSSLKAGDVLLVTGPNHKFSMTERISYLILNMELTEEQAQKLTRPEERELDEDELSEEERQMIEEEKKRAKEEDREYEPEPRTETLRARAYRIDLSDKAFEGFKANDLLSGQPYKDIVFDWGVVEKKKSALKD